MAWSVSHTDLSGVPMEPVRTWSELDERTARRLWSWLARHLVPRTMTELWLDGVLIARVGVTSTGEHVTTEDHDACVACGVTGTPPRPPRRKAVRAPVQQACGGYLCGRTDVPLTDGACAECWAKMRDAAAYRTEYRRAARAWLYRRAEQWVSCNMPWWQPSPIGPYLEFLSRGGLP